MKLTLKVKTLLLVSAVVVIVAASLSATHTTRQRQTLTQALERVAQVLARNLAFNSEYGVLVADRQGLQDLVDGVRQEKDVVYAAVFDEAQQRLASGMPSEVDRLIEAAPHLTSPRPLIRYVNQQGLRVCVAQHPVKLLRRQRWTEGGLLELPETTEEERVGTAVVALSTESLQAHIASVRRATILLTCLIVLVASTLCYVLISLLTRPLVKLKAATQEVASGNLAVRLASRSRDEVGELARAFNQMAENLQRTTVSRDYVDNILSSMSDTLIVVDPDGTIRTVNRAACVLLGYTAEELISQPLSVVFPPGEAQFQAGTLEVLQPEIWLTSHVERTYRAKDGRLIPVLFSGSVMRDEGGRAQGIVCVAQDITERKRAEEALQQQAKELARSNAELEQFAYVASHDLQEPLRVVAAYAQLLAKRYQAKLDADADDFIAFVVDGVKRMQTLISDLLVYSRVGTRGQALVPIDTNAVLAETLTNLQVAIQESGAVIEHDGLPVVQGDALQLGQLFQNFLSNAIKFHGPEPPRIQVTARPEGREWLFAVRDNGIGIDPQYAQRIFVIFQRLHTTEKYPGTGIGLAICKKIIERHGGRIWVESQPGQGATFYFTLPAADT